MKTLLTTLILTATLIVGGCATHRPPTPAEIAAGDAGPAPAQAVYAREIKDLVSTATPFPRGNTVEVLTPYRAWYRYNNLEQPDDPENGKILYGWTIPAKVEQMTWGNRRLSPREWKFFFHEGHLFAWRAPEGVWANDIAIVRRDRLATAAESVASETAATGN
ncbi:hypothetical protein OpiT1DRAFT_00168 [Opitutaceae bacterium TAV1]|nr:hypothetical protein OpiT1DRAFT_00168 [Opitutaceae bacterium TAV1]